MLLMVAIASVSFVAGMIFMLVGAWPVLGFFGLDVAVIYLAFKANYRWARIYETVRLTRDSARRTHKSVGKGPALALPALLAEGPNRSAGQTRQSAGVIEPRQALNIGAFLSPDERVEVANALQGALPKLHRPEHLR